MKHEEQLKALLKEVDGLVEEAQGKEHLGRAVAVQIEAYRFRHLLRQRELFYEMPQP